MKKILMNLGLIYLFLVNIENNEYLKKLKLAESIKVKTIVNPDINTDLSNITN